ncbi:MAG: PqqD family protein [Armatimonadetes bacterium]|nr:PqqD family protein [Armatimonadota bacterium]
MGFLFGRRRRGAPALSRVQATAARPIRNPALSWHETEQGCVVVTIPRRQDLVGKILAWLFMVPESRPVVLDEIGSFVWKLCDGERSFAEIAAALSREYTITSREAEVSLAEFMRRLGRRGMIAFILPKHIADQLTPEQRRELGIKLEEPADGNSRRPADKDQRRPKPDTGKR